MVVSLSALMAVILLVGMATTSFRHVLIAASRTILPKNCSEQFGKPTTVQVTPLTPFSPTSPNIPILQYHMTLTSTDYNMLRRSASFDASSSASLALLLAPSRSFTFALLACSSPSWIVNLGASFHMIGTSSLLSSYHPTPSHPLVTIADG